MLNDIYSIIVQQRKLLLSNKDITKTTKLRTCSLRAIL